MQNKPILIANWKMNGSMSFCAELVSSLRKSECRLDFLDLVIAPPLLYARRLLEERDKNGLDFALAGQDCHFASQGPYTGDHAACMLKDIGCKYVIIGHSERRDYYKESNALVQQKSQSALESGVLPIVCVGEKNRNSFASELKKQCKYITHKAGIVAYEPVYSVGTDIIPTLEEIKESVEVIKSSIEYDLPIIYGGSVKEQNCSQILNVKGVRGLLLGRPSLNAKIFTSILCNISAIKE